MTTDFTPFQSLLGGIMIGTSAVIMMAAFGKITGISGIFSQLLTMRSQSQENATINLAFILGLLVFGPIVLFFGVEFAIPLTSDSLYLLGIAGILVGLGVSLGNGCTSGHGVCGISRLSARSIVATIIFMLTAFLTVFILRHVLGA